MILCLGLWLGWKLRAVTVPLLAAYLLSLMLMPLQVRLQRKLGRGLAAIVCLLSVLLFVAALCVPCIYEFDALSKLLPSSADTNAWVNNLYQKILDLRAKLPESLQERVQITEADLQKYQGEILDAVASAGTTVVGFLGGIFSLLSALLLLPLFAFFLLRGAPWLPAIRAELPPDWHPRWDRVAPRIQRILRDYCRSRLLVALLKGAVYFLSLLLFGVPGAYTLGLMAGAASLLPFLGPLVAVIFVALVSFADMGVAGLGVAFGTWALGELLEGYVFLPYVVGRHLDMSDFTVLLALFCGGALMGMFGILIAIPAVAVGRVLYDEFVRPVMGTQDHARSGA